MRKFIIQKISINPPHIPLRPPEPMFAIPVDKEVILLGSFKVSKVGKWEGEREQPRVRANGVEG